MSETKDPQQQKPVIADMHPLPGTPEAKACGCTCSVAQPSAAHRKLLKMPRHGVVLVVNRRSYTTAGQAIELTTSVYRGDLYTPIVSSIRIKKAPDTPGGSVAARGTPQIAST